MELMLIIVDSWRIC